MLVHSNDQKVIEGLWDSLEVKAQLPAWLEKDFFACRGPMPVFSENKRAFHRYYMRFKALLRRRDTLLGSYTKDVSRQGVGFLSPVELLPQERVQLRLPAAELNLQVTRCRRVDKGCFECGAIFAL
jgi:hypothetical protein